MANTLAENFEITAKLEVGAAVKIQAALRCLEDNFPTRVDLSDPEEGGNSVKYVLVSGEMVDLTDCCGLRDVTVTPNGDKTGTLTG